MGGYLRIVYGKLDSILGGASRSGFNPSIKNWKTVFSVSYSMGNYAKLRSRRLTRKIAQPSEVPGSSSPRYLINPVFLYLTLKGGEGTLGAGA